IKGSKPESKISKIIKEEETGDLENHDHPTDFFNDAYRVTSEESNLKI
ncbi:5915_t:CDS:2, partial [Entrophospora sp. SA101]